MNLITRCTNWLSQHFVFVVASIFILKLGLLFWSAHPFDFSAFAGVMERHAVVGWNIFEYWNKGGFLIVMWYPFYALYLVILEIARMMPDQLLLLHFFMKFPFWIIDLLSFVLIVKLAGAFTRSQIRARWAGLLWVISPLVFGVYGIHGHYELLVGFAILWMFVALAWNMPVLFGLAFAIAFSTKYFIVIVAPLFFFFLLFRKEYRFMLVAGISAAIGIVASYIQFFFAPELISQTIGSINNLSQAYVASPDSVVTTGALNIFSAVRFFLEQGVITNTGSPGWFAVASNSFIYGGLFALFVYLRQVYFLYIRRDGYTILNLFTDTFLVLAGFVIVLTNFQWHYMMWFIPFFVILAVIDRFYTVLLGGVTLIGFLLFFRNEFGPRTFFLDIADSLKLLTVSSMDMSLKYVLVVGSITFFVLSIIFILTRHKKTHNSPDEKAFGYVVLVSCIAWILIVGTFGQAIVHYVAEKKHQTVLAFRRPDSPRAVIQGTFLSHTGSLDREKIFDTTATSDAKILEGIDRYLSKEDRDKFDAYVVFPGTDPIPNEGEFVFNKLCPLNFRDQQVVRSFLNRDQSNYVGVEVPIQCVGRENAVMFDMSVYLAGGVPHPRLIVVRDPDPVLYKAEYRTFMHIVGSIGFAGTIGGLGFYWLLIRSLGKRKTHEELS